MGGEHQAKEGDGVTLRPMVHYDHYTVGASLCINLPIIVVSESNLRDKWARINRAKVQRKSVYLFLSGLNLPELPATIRLVRLGARTLDDDNLATAFKSVRDEIASIYGTDDGSRLYRWEYAQEKGKADGIRVEITSTADPAPKCEERMK